MYGLFRVWCGDVFSLLNNVFVSLNVVIVRISVPPVARWQGIKQRSQGVFLERAIIAVSCVYPPVYYYKYDLRFHIIN